MTDELRAARVAIVRDAAAPASAPSLKRAALEPLEVATPEGGLEPIAPGLATVVKAFVLEGEEVEATAAAVGQASGLPVVLAAQAARIRELAATLAALAHAEARAREELDASPAGPVRLGLEDAAAKALAPLLSAAGVSAAQVVDLTPPPQMAAPPPKVGSATAALGAKPAPKPLDVAIRVGAKKAEGAREQAKAEAPKAEEAEATPRVDLGGDADLVLPYLVRAAVDHGRGKLDDAGLVTVAKALAGLAQQGLLPEGDDPRLLVTVAPAAARAQEEAARRADAQAKPRTPGARADAAPPALDDAALAAYSQALLDLVSPLRRALRPALEAARATPRRLVFAHGDDPRVVAAARQLADEGLATPWLLGDLFRLETRAKEQGTSLKGIRVIDPARDKRRGPYAAALLAASGTRGITPEDAARLVEEPVVFAALAVLQGEADALLLSDGHGEGLEPLGLAGELLARREKIRGLAGTHLVSVAGRSLVVTDTSASSDPTCEEVADAALQAAGLARTLLGVEPRVAFVTFTTHGAKGDPTVQRLGLARDLVRVRDKTLKVDGPLTVDVALDAAVQAARLPSCALGGEANVLVVADRSAGALLVGALGTLAGAEAIGPLLGGLRQPATIAPRGATRADLVLLGALTVAQVVAAKTEESGERPALESGARGRTPQPGEVTRPSAAFGAGAATATAVKPEVRLEPKSDVTPRPSIRPALESKPEPTPRPEPAPRPEPTPRPAPKPMTLGQKPSDMGTPARTPPPPKPDAPPSRPLR